MIDDDLVVVAAAAEAASALAELEATCFDVPWTVDALRALLADGLTRAWIASRGRRTVGGALVRVVAGEAELLRIAVGPEDRRRGVGRRLLQIVMSALADACPEGVHLEVRGSNVAARHLYAREGFVEYGRRRDYYQAPREDAILMHWRPVPSRPVRA
jgi:ribosomal-protein-alanine N-acetyltransferase